MEFKGFRPVFVGAAIFLSGCTFADDSLLPRLTGGDPRGASTTPVPSQQAQTPAPGTMGNQPALGTTNFEPTGVTEGQNTGTFVGQKVNELRGELRRLQQDVSKNNTDLQTVRAKTVGDSQKYHASIAAINSRLQVGTTPGNPILVQQFNQALTQLDQIGDDISRMNVVTTQVTADSTLANFLSENTRAALRLSGAVDEDHRQLAILEDEVNRTVVLIDRLLKELTDDIVRQTNYVSSERANLNTLSAAIKSGEMFGSDLTNRALTAATVGMAPMAQGVPTSALGSDGRRPLVVIRFDRPDVQYDQALYNAVSRTLERRPNATFEVAAVAPSTGGAGRVALNSNQARRNAEAVVRSLQRMGLPQQRVAITSRTSDQALANEVHLYVN
jgi:hypothetical protein